MRNANGWGLTARLMAKHFSVLGESVAEAFASFDPETASEADRDRLADTLHASARVLATARASFDKEHADVERLRTLIANDEKAIGKLAARLAAGTISQATVTMFCEELEANKARLPQEVQADADARASMDELQQIIDTLSRELADYDADGSKTWQAAAAASAQNRMPELSVHGQSGLAGLPGITGNSAALDVHARRAQSLAHEAARVRLATGMEQQRLDHASRDAAIRKSISAFQTAGETALQRLQRLSARVA